MFIFNSYISGLSRKVVQEKFVVGAFFIITVFIGLFCFKDYGFSFDEPTDFRIGLVNAKFVISRIFPEYLNSMPILENVEHLAKYQDRHYGSFFQLPASILPYLLGFTDTQDIFYTRHLLTYLFFCLGLFFFYQVLRFRFTEWKFALLGVMLLFLSPRIFADAFYNSKDIVFLSLVIACWFTLTKLMKKQTLKWVVLHALACGAALDTRIMAFIFPGLTFLWALQEIVFSRTWVTTKRMLLLGLFYLVFLVGFTILFWPYLWEKPVLHFSEVFDWLDRGGDWYFNVLYWGDLIPFNRLPWHYIPGWILVTTPLIYIAWFGVGFSLFVADVFKRRLSLIDSEFGKQDFNAFLIFFLPLFVVIYTNAILYDGWRHMFFIYPPVIYFSILGIKQAWDWYHSYSAKLSVRIAARVMASVTAFNIIYVAIIMVRVHPYQNVYFSFLSPNYIEKSFDLDYWGLSYRESLAYILKHDKRPQVLISVNNGGSSENLLPKKDRERIKFVPESEAEYYITEYRWHPQRYPYWDEIYRVEVNGVRISSVFKLR